MSESGDKGRTGASRRLKVAAVAVPVVLAVIVAAVVGSRLLEQRACTEAGRVDSLSGWMEYLGSHPRGRCAERARERVKTLEHSRWVRVSAGSFKMGMVGFDLLGSGDETTHDVVLTRPFTMLATELTRGQWASEMGEAPAHSRFKDCGLDCPVEGVNWYDALAFCNALSEREGFTPCYALSDCQGAPGQQMRCREVVFAGLDCDGYRLPTEAEWEYAARADGNGRFPFGDGCPVPERINFNARRPMPECPAGPASEGPVPVGSLDSANPWGLWDMAGNVSEWVWDAYGPYPEGEVVDPLGSDQPGSRVHRGGSWRSSYYDVRVQARGRTGPAQVTDTIGFRPVRTLP